MKLKLEEELLEKRYLKKFFWKRCMDVIERNHQINITFEHSFSSIASFEKYLNAKSFKMFWEYCISYAKHDAAVSVSVARWCERTRVMWIQL